MSSTTLIKRQSLIEKEFLQQVMVPLKYRLFGYLKWAFNAVLQWSYRYSYALVKPLSHHMGLANQMEAEQSPLKCPVNVHFLYI